MMSMALAAVLSGIVSAGNVEFVGVTPEIINGLPMSSPQGLAVNPKGDEFLVADALNDRILVFDSTGAAVFDFSLGEDRHTPFGIAVDSSEEIIVGAMDLPVLWIYDYSGLFVEELPLPDGVLPGRMDVGQGNNIYMVNRAGKEILYLARDGRVLAKYESPEQECKPSGLCLAVDNKVLLISSAGNAVNIFDQSGKLDESFGEHGRRPEDFSFPAAAAIDNRGGFWVADSFRHEIKHFDSKFKYIGIFGQRGTEKGEFYFPVDIKITSEGKMAVLDKGSGRLQIFRINYDK
jgi:hypothetical protein